MAVLLSSGNVKCKRWRVMREKDFATENWLVSLVRENLEFGAHVPTVTVSFFSFSKLLA